ncbi:DUF4870 domain-containing protein [Bacillus sp. R86525]|uniref:DUF4870 domain-containing protein n=1 Tax=Bacillus sp. R86525 TaxID=3101709 RepID=UPI00366F34EF
MKSPTKKQQTIVQLMLGASLVFGFLPPLLMFLITRKKNVFYREVSRKALNFHLTIFPFFFISYFSPPWYVNVIYVVLVVELVFILNAMIRIALRKSHNYPISISYIKKKESLGG